MLQETFLLEGVRLEFEKVMFRIEFQIDYRLTMYTFYNDFEM